MTLLIVALATFAAVGGVAALAVDTAGRIGSDPARMPKSRIGGAAEVLAADGSLIGFVHGKWVREPLAEDQIPTVLREATVAIEDKGFFDHGALDYEAIARAAITNIANGSVVQGGSTITQQLAKNLYFRHPAETLRRKLREARLATGLEDAHSKAWILDQYLNSVPYGTNGGVTDIGAEAASRTYFNRSAADLDLRRAALLAGIPQAPSDYNPLENPHAARERRNEVLDQMHEQGYIGTPAWRHAKHASLGIDPGARYASARYPYFLDYVEQQLVSRFGLHEVRDGGLVVTTSLDPRLQDLAQQAVDAGAARLGGPSAALVATDVATGHVLAMANSTDYATDQFNLAADGHRQPGSSFKPFVLATALQQGIDPDTTYYDGSSPVTLHPYGPGGEAWTVHNAEPGKGTMSVTEATTDSVNAVYAQLALDVGPQNVADMAHSLGITSPLDGVPAEAIGGLRVGVTPLEMSNAYASFADGGVHRPVSAIERVVVPDVAGNPTRTDEPGQGKPTRAMPESQAATETRVLETVIASGTGTAADIGCPAAGKTGTTDGQTDAWFVGYTPEISTAVWTGYPDSRQSMGTSAFGGTFAAPIWHQFMAAAGGACDDFSFAAGGPTG